MSRWARNQPATKGASRNQALRAHAVRMTKFGVVGLVNTAVDFAAFSVLFYAAGLPLLVANTLSYVTGALNSYVLNKIWTFRDPSRGTEMLRRATLFFALNLAGLALANLAIWLLAMAMPAWLAKIGAVGVTFLWNYVTNHRFVYRSA